jgi:TolA-binding protein
VERVRLEAGSLAIHVRPQQPGERFLVLLPDGDLEVRGTTFDVTVTGGKTAAVHVTEGVVEVRIAGYPVRRLEAGAAWSASASPAPGASDASKAPPRDDGAAAYATALRALGAGDNEGASSVLRAFVAAHPDAPQTEDATFLEAVALARAGRIDAAGAAAEEHLARFPSSFHRKEALVLVDRAARARDAGASPRSP